MPTAIRPDHYDALIVGARCAGAATAMLLARAGLRVLLIDRDDAGADTMSTHALMRGAVMQLDRWGLLDPLIAAGTPPVRKTTFFYGTECYPLDIRPSFGVDALVAPRRHLLDATLVWAARAAGAVVRHRTALRDVMRNADTGRVTGAVLSGRGDREYTVSADLVIGADGRRSLLARKLDAANIATSHHRTCCLYGYFDGMQDDGYRWYYDTETAAGAIPTNDGAHCVFVAVSDAEFGQVGRAGTPSDVLLSLARRTHVEFGDEIAAAHPVSRPIVFAGAAGHLRQSHGPGWALVGDAGYFKDPLTAHGITDALRDAEILARAVVAGTEAALAQYQTTRDGLSRELFDVTDRIASFDWSMSALQAMHKQLNQTMKAENAWMYGTFAPMGRAA